MKDYIVVYKKGFTDKQTKEKYAYNNVISLTQERVKEIRKVEQTNGIKLIEKYNTLSLINKDKSAQKSDHKK